MKAKKRVQKIKLKKVLKKRDSEDLRILKILQREKQNKDPKLQSWIFWGETEKSTPRK
jgi:hypothetical protein